MKVTDMTERVTSLIPIIKNAESFEDFKPVYDTLKVLCEWYPNEADLYHIFGAAMILAVKMYYKDRRQEDIMVEKSMLLSAINTFKISHKEA